MARSVEHMAAELSQVLTSIAKNIDDLAAAQSRIDSNSAKSSKHTSEIAGHIATLAAQSAMQARCPFDPMADPGPSKTQSKIGAKR